MYEHGDTLHYQKAPLNMGIGTLCNAEKPRYIWAWRHFALPKGSLYMGMGTPCSATTPPKNGHTNALHCRKALLYMGTKTLHTAKKLLMYGHRDTLQCQKDRYIRAWGHFALTKSPVTYGHGDNLRCQLPKSFLNMGIGSLCSRALKDATPPFPDTGFMPTPALQPAYEHWRAFLLVWIALVEPKMAVSDSYGWI